MCPSHELWLMGYREAHYTSEMELDSRLVHIPGHRLSGAESAVKHYLSMDQPPTAYIVPDMRIAHSLIQAYARHGVALENQTVITVGSPERARMFGLESCPRFHLADLAEAAIHRLLNLIDQKPACATRMLLNMT